MCSYHDPPAGLSFASLPGQEVLQLLLVEMLLALLLRVGLRFQALKLGYV